MPGPVYTITIDPSPLTQGGKATITYDGPVGTVLTLDWDPPAEPSTVTIDNKGKARFTVPSAIDVIVSDPWGNTATSTVTP